MSALLLLSLLAAASPQAKAHRDAGHAAFEIAEYDRAIEEFKAAYELEPDPRLFYNLGLAHLKRFELKSARPDLVQSRDYFKRFLAFVKTGDAKMRQLRELAVEYVARIDAELAKPEPPPPAPPPPPPQIVEVPVEPPPVDHTTSIAILGSSGALIAGAIVTGIFAVRSSNDASMRAKNFALATDVLIVGGLLAGAAGLVLFFVEAP
jgi:tetratricopeptide (TPR) repeat protein